MSTAPGFTARLALAALPVAVIAALVALLSSGAATESVIGDPGVIARWGGPVISALLHLCAALVLGSLVLLLAVLPYRPDDEPGRRGAGGGGSAQPRRHPAWARAATVLAVAGPLWAVLNLLDVLLRYSRAAGRPLGGAGFGTELGYYLTGIAAGRLALIASILIAVAAIACVAVASYRTAVIAAVPAFAVLLPWSGRGHASTAAEHQLAVSAMFLHLLGVTIWVGGLFALCLVVRSLGPAISVTARRYSAVALASYVLVGISGLASGWLRIESLADLAGPYGRLLVVKAVLFVVLGGAGWWHRRRTLGDLTDPSRRRSAFLRLAGGEVLLMSAVMGVSAALAATPAPAPESLPYVPSPAEELSGRPVPPEPTAFTWLTLGAADLLFIVALLALAGLYLAGVIRLRRREIAWPVGRTAVFLAGLTVLGWVVLGGPAIYGALMFSAHMIAHMTLAMVIPIALVLAAPMTLALRALPVRRDGSRGPREWLLIALHSPPARFFSNPIVAAVNFAGSMILFYFTPLFQLSLTNHLGHVLMITHFLLVGYLFVNALIGVDPGPQRPSHALRLVLLFATMAFHAFFGVALLQMDTLLAADYFGALGLPWGVDALADQRIGAAITWGLGEIPTICIAIGVALSWYRDDTREARRRDRAADRDGDAELRAYNEMLAELRERDSQR